MITPLSYADTLRIGSVEFVSPDEIKASLDIEAPTDLALNTGVPRPFPRVNGYVLLPSENGFMVAQIVWITIERSQFPVRKGMKDFGIIDLPYPLRKMSLNPLGMLREINASKDREECLYEFTRGIEVYPTVGDPVLLPTPIQLKSIVESGENRFVKIGISPIAGNATVSVDPDRLFGRHFAVLGNTGSGKSCSVAGIIRWSIEAAKQQRINATQEHEEQEASVNTRFIILDPNGEYSEAFSGLANVRLFSVEASETANQLHVPIWFWNSAEWTAFTQAGSGAQRPTLIQALRSVRDGHIYSGITPSNEMRKYLRTLISIIEIEINKGNPWRGGGITKGFKERLENWRSSLTEADSFSQTEKEAIVNLNQKIDDFFNSNKSGNEEWPMYTLESTNSLLSEIKKTYFIFGGSDSDVLPIDADVPRPFTGEQLLRSIEANAELMRTTEYTETMLMRIRTLLSDSRLKTILTGDTELSLEEWLNSYICESNSVEGSVTIIDLSLVPAEVVHIITAVIARMTLEALQRYRKINKGKTLPTTIVMEEAHTFIKRYQESSENITASSMCTQVFEKIAREGRKFGLSLMLSSQRPSELSQTVLSQCNTFLLHRISNDRDQELVSKLVPDNLRGLLRELPSLPSRNAILLGWASELPVLVQMNYLKKEHQPKSSDPKYWEVWTGEKERIVNWKSISDDWQQLHLNSCETDLVNDDEDDL